MQQKIYDIIIAGAGPAGLTAAVYARRAGKSVLLIEKEAFGGQITLSPHVENYPFTRPMSGNELVEVLVEQVMNLGADVEVGAVVAVSENADKTVTVRTDYQEFTGRTLIIATGLKHRLPGAEGEQKFIGSGISFCAVCDGAFFKDKAVAVIGGGNTAAKEQRQTQQQNQNPLHVEAPVLANQPLPPFWLPEANLAMICESKAKLLSFFALWASMA